MGYRSRPTGDALGPETPGSETVSPGAMLAAGPSRRDGQRLRGRRGGGVKVTRGLQNGLRHPRRPEMKHRRPVAPTPTFACGRVPSWKEVRDKFRGKADRGWCRGNQLVILSAEEEPATILFATAGGTSPKVTTDPPLKVGHRPRSKQCAPRRACLTQETLWKQAKLARPGSCATVKGRSCRPATCFVNELAPRGAGRPIVAYVSNARRGPAMSLTGYESPAAMCQCRAGRSRSAKTSDPTKQADAGGCWDAPCPGRRGPRRAIHTRPLGFLVEGDEVGHAQTPRARPRRPGFFRGPKVGRAFSSPRWRCSAAATCCSSVANARSADASLQRV